MPVPKRLYELFCGAFAREAKAVALAESNEDPLAISPGGLSVGIMQQGADWQTTYPPSDPGVASWFHPLTTSHGTLLYQHAMAGGPWHPAFQLACYATFANKHSALDRLARLRLYHYGHEQDADPDGYAEHVMTFYGVLEGW
jgi:hypothetical protein